MNQEITKMNVMYERPENLRGKHIRQIAKSTDSAKRQICKSPQNFIVKVEIKIIHTERGKLFD